MTPVLRKASQLNIKYRENGGPIIDVCLGAPTEEVTALHVSYSFFTKNESRYFCTKPFKYIATILIC